jgi:ATP-dependent Lhr-like helicase
MLPGVSVAEFDWCDPLVDANAVRGLKFSAALPLELAVDTLGSRLGDLSAAQTVFVEARAIVR